MNNLTPLDIADLKQAVAAELAQRRCAGADPSFAEERGGPEALYGLTGAVNIHAALGLPLGDRATRTRWAARILAYRDSDGHFTTGEGPGHALHMVLGALNLLGEPIPGDIGPLAPRDPGALEAWMEAHDWQSTHKELCGQTIPLLASSGMVSRPWTARFTQRITERLPEARPLETWCQPDDPPWRVISCLYHVLSAFDAGRLPYPKPEQLVRRLLDLHWEEAPDTERRTVCTDGDWAWLLLRLSEALPHHAEAALDAIRRVSVRRVQAWQTDCKPTLSRSTHHLYCYIWVTAVFQSCMRDHYTGGYLRDTLNDPALFRL